VDIALVPTAVEVAVEATAPSALPVTALVPKNWAWTISIAQIQEKADKAAITNGRFILGIA
jgi:hypothetical protein